MYFLLNMGIFHCYVSLPEGIFEDYNHQTSCDELNMQKKSDTRIKIGKYMYIYKYNIYICMYVPYHK